MESLNLEQLFKSIDNFLSESRLKGAWRARKDDVLEIVIIHRSSKSDSDDVKIESETNAEICGGDDIFEASNESATHHPRLPPLPHTSLPAIECFDDPREIKGSSGRCKNARNGISSGNLNSNRNRSDANNDHDSRIDLSVIDNEPPFLEFFDDDVKLFDENAESYLDSSLPSDPQFGSYDNEGEADKEFAFPTTKTRSGRPLRTSASAVKTLKSKKKKNRKTKKTLSTNTTNTTATKKELREKAGGEEDEGGDGAEGPPSCEEEEKEEEETEADDSGRRKGSMKNGEDSITSTGASGLKQVPLCIRAAVAARIKKAERKKRSGRPLTFPELKRNSYGVIQCPLCDETFERTPRALTHYRKVHKKIVYPCEKCPREFYDLPSLKFHEDILHNDGEGQLVCQQCGVRFHNISGIKYHVKRVHSDSVSLDGVEKPKLKCSFSGCTATFDHHFDKQTHLFAEHPEKMKYCQVCKRPFTSEKYLFTHLKTAHSDAPMAKCKYCEKEYALEESLSYHCDEEHEDEDVGPKQFICPVPMCLKRFVSQANVEAHGNVHKAWVTRKQNRLNGVTSKTPPKRKKSDDCGTAASSSSAAESSSTAERSPCEVCGKLVLASKMRQHIKDSHDRDEQKFRCNECGRMFDRKDRLRNHRLIQHVKRELKCIYCQKVYYSRKVLTAHVKGVHEKVRHQCPMCERSYSQRPDLLVHIKGVHEGKRSLCSICGKEFIRSSEKNRHERQVHNLHKSAAAGQEQMAPPIPTQQASSLPPLPPPNAVSLQQHQPTLLQPIPLPMVAPQTDMTGAGLMSVEYAA